MFKKKKNKIYSLQYDLDAFVVRITNERVDVETRSKTWKQVFLKGTPEYLTFVYILAPHMMVDPAIRAEKRDAERDRENATSIAKTAAAIGVPNTAANAALIPHIIITW